MADIRTFVAVPLAGETREEVTRFQARLRACQADVKWVEPGNLHLTLRFLGSLAPPAVARAAAAVDRACRYLPAFSLELGGTGVFPSLARPRVLWLGVRAGGEALARVARAVEAALVEAGFPPNGRSFSPHLTLGRFRSPAGAQDVLAAAAAAPARFSRLQVGEVHVMKSVLSPGGPAYTSLARVPLGGAP